ncbi:hypothetical protein NDU88_002595 [Pleurodeles waltl]|uniref:Reverse transcriptase RNase H-like domain-containing protein n=1 Tax=Pleurodeles waltl TaxID=8319 RepID=A0AAV7SC53_PLEWA|nr:hypothetical protein NDU88_002595 [Pleurodeles waltl]
MGEVEIRGLWYPAEPGLHINLQEHQAIRLALKAFLPSLKGKVVQVFTDNTTTMWYSNKEREVGSLTICQEELRLWTWLEYQGITLMVQHLAGSLSARADELSRRCLADHKWYLHREVVTPFHLGQNITLPTFFAPPHPSKEEERLHRLDPKRALSFYLDCTKEFWVDDQLFVGGTHPSADDPRVPAADGCLDPEGLLGTTGRAAEVAPSGFLKNPHRHSRRDPPPQEDVSWRPADAKEEDCGQQKPWDTKNQEEPVLKLATLWRAWPHQVREVGRQEEGLGRVHTN